MFPQKLSKQHTTSQTLLLSDGPNKAKSTPGLHQAEIGCTMPKISPPCLMGVKVRRQRRKPCKRKRSSTQESHQAIKNPTSLDKSPICNPHTPHTPSSKTLGQGLTGIERGFKPFWNESLTAVSAELWLPTKTDSPDSPGNSSAPSSMPVAANSWFTANRTRPKTGDIPMNTNLQKTLWRLQTSLWQGTMAKDPPSTDASETKNGPEKKKQKSNKVKPKPKPMKTRKIRVYPTLQQRKLLASWYGVARWTYNQCLHGIKVDKIAKSKKELRKHFLNKKNRDPTLPPIPDWVFKVPFDIRDEAMNDLLKGYKTCFSKGERFKMRYRSKKRSNTECIAILKKHWNHSRGVYASIFAPDVLKSSEPLPTDLEADSRLIRTRLGKYYLCLPVSMPTLRGCENQAPSIAAIDPGVRTFATVYSTTGEVTEWGSGDVGRIQRLCYHYDKLQSKWSQKGVRSAKRRRMRRAGYRLQERIRNCVTELHRKLALYLCKNHTLILLPTFETQQMTSKKCTRRKINCTTARAMCTWSHYRFRQHLIHKARMFNNCTVALVSEAYTSKTCGSCGKLHPRLGSAKVFKCPHCHLQCDRDINGARNVLLRALAQQCAA